MEYIVSPFLNNRDSASYRTFFFFLIEQTGQLEPLLKKFTEEEEKQMKRMLQRLDVLAKVSLEENNTQRYTLPSHSLWVSRSGDTSTF